MIAERFAPLLAACDRLHDFTIAMREPWGGRAIDGLHEQLMLIVFSRSSNTFCGATELARVGFGAQAAMLNRSLFEDMIDAHWITVKPELAVQRIGEHHLHGQMLLADAARAEELMPAHEIPSFDATRRAELDETFGQYGEKSWTALGTYSRVMDVEHLWDDQGRKDLHTHRRLVHRESNQLLHLSAFSMSGQIRERTEDTLTLALGPSDQYVEKALFAAFWTYGQLTSVVRDTFGFDDDECWQRAYGDPFESA